MRAGWEPLRRALLRNPRACVPVVCLERAERSACLQMRGRSCPRARTPHTGASKYPPCAQHPQESMPASLKALACFGREAALPEQARRRRIDLGPLRVCQDLPKERLLSGSTSAIASRLRALWTSSAVEWASVSWTVQSIVGTPPYELGTLGTMTSRTSAAAALRLGGFACSYSSSHAGALRGDLLLSSRHW